MANRVVKLTDPEQAATKYEYNPVGQKVKETNGLEQTTVYTYDAAGRIIKVTDPLGVEVTYGYDNAGNKLYMTDGRGKVTQYGYGAFGWMQVATNAVSLSIRYQYDLAGNVTGITDRMDHHIAYTYDSRNLLLNKQVKETGDALSYSYDEAGNRLTMSDDSGTSSYTYDKKNQLLNISRNGAVQISYTYDAAGNIESVIDKTGAATTYTYDKSNRMETVVFKGHTTTYNYDENGNRQAISYEGGIKEEYSFDRNNRVVTLTNHKPNGDVISSYSYTYDAAGQQASKTDSYGTTNYTYDAAGRIAKVEAPGKTTVYAYDGSGNRQTLNETYTSVQPSGYFDPNTKVEVQYKVKKSEYVYSNTNELLKLVEAMYDEAGTELLEKTTSYLYDENGNQIRQKVGYIHPYNRSMRQVTGGNLYGDNVTDELNTLIEKVNSTYDGFNQLKQMEKLKAGERVTVDYTYNGDGLRTKKVVRSSKDNYAEKVTNYLYDRQHVVLETDASDQVIVRYVRGINYIARADSSDKLSYYLYNGHGDVVQTVSAAGEVENQYDYDVFGNPTLTVETGYSNAIRYAGEFMDVETGLYYLRARYYDPYTGRFMSQDSYWGEDTNPLSLNLYTYGHNNPIMYIDPSGHSVLSSILTSIVVGAVVKAVVDYVTGNSSSSSSGSSRSSRGGGSSQAAEKAKAISKEIQNMMSKAADVVYGVKGSSVISQGNSAMSYGNVRDREFSSLLKSSLPTTLDMLNDYLMSNEFFGIKKKPVKIASAGAATFPVGGISAGAGEGASIAESIATWGRGFVVAGRTAGLAGLVVYGLLGHPTPAGGDLPAEEEPSPSIVYTTSDEPVAEEHYSDSTLNYPYVDIPEVQEQEVQVDEIPVDKQGVEVTTQPVVNQEPMHIGGFYIQSEDAYVDELPVEEQGPVLLRTEVKYADSFNENHFIIGEGIVNKGGTGVVGAHNMDHFYDTLKQTGLNVGDLIESKIEHPDFPGLYQIKYKIPALKYGPDGDLVPSGELKTIKNPKTVYDPVVYSDAQMIQWGKEAMKEAFNANRIDGRETTGFSSNGMQFRGYLNIQGEITNFFPVFK